MSVMEKKQRHRLIASADLVQIPFVKIRLLYTSWHTINMADI